MRKFTSGQVATPEVEPGVTTDFMLKRKRSMSHSQAEAVRPTSAPPAHSSASSHARLFIIAWAATTIFYLLEYMIRSAPAVMIPELTSAFGTTPVGLSSILGLYYYTYSVFSLVAGLLLDRLGAKRVVAVGAGIVGVGCLLFFIPSPLAGEIGRLLQGAGSAFAFTGAVYLAAHGFPANRLATAIGVTQAVGLFGGSVGQLGVGPLTHGVIAWQSFWIGIGVITLVVAVLIAAVTPRKTEPGSDNNQSAPSWFAPYKIVFRNPQSYLCGLIAGLLFAPTTVGDMVWAVAFFEKDRLFDYQAAVWASAMVPLGWVVGAPLLGWLADALGRRKPVLIGGSIVALLMIVQLVFLPLVLPTAASLFLIGVGSGAAMIPYSIIKEVNPDEVKGSATGAMNFLTFLVTAIIGPIFAQNIAQSLGVVEPSINFQEAGMFWIAAVAVAILLSLLLRETGHARLPARTRSAV
jgi:MFS family permease